MSDVGRVSIRAIMLRRQAELDELTNRSGAVTRYLISFDDGAMAHIPDGEWPAVAEAAHAVVREAKDAGVWIHGGGIQQQRPRYLLFKHRCCKWLVWV